MAEPFLASVRTNYPEPPYSWIGLDMFPPRAGGTFPRDDLQLRRGQVGWGYLYFRLPDDLPVGDTRWELLFRPSGAGETYAVDFAPFAARR
jgi:hypothetical protein